MKPRHLLSALGGAAALAASGQAGAQTEPGQFSTGEFTQVFSCFYECKPGPTVAGVPTWQEITTLVVVNQNADETVTGGTDNGRRVINIKYLGANQNVLGASRGAGVPDVNDFGLDLSSGDLDEINICRTLEADPRIGAVPEIGLVELYVAAATPGAGVYAWIKNLLGKFFVTENEPFAGSVKAVAKTECRLVPPEVATAGQVAAQFFASGAPGDVPIILVEGSDP
ncbi:MAG: hypothetical protein M3Z21_16955 [Pseudomonadota bacterium]|nr:hypothetical protein [Pseudomonadota bacterium]